MVSWTNKPLGKIAEVKTGPFGSSLHAGDYVVVGTPIITVEHLGEISITQQNLPLVSEADKQRLSAYLLKTGDIVFSRVGSVDRNALVTKRENGWLFSGRLLRIRIETNEVDAKYLSYYFKFEAVIQRIRDIAVGQTMASLNTKLLNSFIIEYPPLPEQRAIAAALSDVDGYIAALEKLIAKKRDIKKGVMQELLTGKRRLPGFSEEWVEKKIEDFPAVVVSGGTPSTFRPEYWGGTIPWMNSGELNLKRIHRVEGRITQLGLENSSTTMVAANSVLIGLAGQGKTRGTVAMNYIRLCTNQSIAAVLPNPAAYCSEYLYQNLDSRYDELRELSTGDGGRGGLNLTILRNLYVPFSSLPEQTAIATILSDMDAEIDALTAKLTKVRNIKQGMMQELLTGRIRLVSESEEEAAPVAEPAAKVMELPKREPEVAASRQTGRHNQQFDDAVMIAGIVNAFYADKYPLGRKKVQKCLYLLRRHQDESTAAFKKKAAGPYADEVRYKGGEPIARSAKYIVTTSGKQGTTFARGGNISQALGYIQSWGKQSDINWLTDKLKYKKVDELELLATVDMAICDLEEAGTPVSVASIKHLIATNAEWKAKLKKQTFSDANIAKAIKELQTLL